jgi:anti-sigma B factor antagonist
MKAEAVATGIEDPRFGRSDGREDHPTMSRLPSGRARELTIARAEEDDGVRLAVGGEVDLSAGPRLEEAVGAALEGRPRRLCLDLAEVCFLDSSGLAGLIGAARRAQERGAELRVASPPGSEARLVIELSGMAGYLGLE